MPWRPTWNEPQGERPQRRFLRDRGGLLPPGVKLVLIITVGVFVLQMAWTDAMFGVGALSVRHVLRLEVWRLVTYMFLHGSIDHILINMFVFAMLGMALERQLGTRHFLWLYFAAGVIGGLFEVIFNVLMYMKYGPVPLNPLGHTFLTMPAVGASAGVAGILVAFATRNPRALFLLFFLIPVQAKWVAIVYALVETRHVILGLTRGWVDRVAHAAHFGGMVLGYVWIRHGTRIAAWWRERRRLRAGRYGAPTPGREAEDQAELDRILRKTHERGVDSLTTQEKLFLQEMSRRYRDRF